MKSSAFFLLVSILVFGKFCVTGGQLRKQFYRKSCPLAEEIVKNITWKHVASNSTVAAKLLRLHFHDCFVRGCDGSVLLDSSANNTAEKDAPPNGSLSGYDIIDEMKGQLEETCPGVVSCADIVALAARDAVSFQFKRPMWEVLSGRRDGNVSLKQEVFTNIPFSFFNFTTIRNMFISKGLSAKDFVVLSGSHTIGVGHCNLFSERLYNFTGKGDSDPSLNATYAAYLRTKCKDLSDNTTAVEMVPHGSHVFDTDYFWNLKLGKGLFQSDAALLKNSFTRKTVDKMLDPKAFFTEFAQSMKRMGAIGVLTGNGGEIRKNCRVVNTRALRNHLG